MGLEDQIIHRNPQNHAPVLCLQKCRRCILQEYAHPWPPVGPGPPPHKPTSGLLYHARVGGTHMGSRRGPTHPLDPFELRQVE